MQVVNHVHPDRDRIIAVIPHLVRALAVRLDVMGQRRLSDDELLALAHRSMESWGPFQFWQAGPCLVGLNVVQPWWSPDPVLAEEFIIRYKPGNFADTIAELEAHAKAQGCKALVISSLAQIRKESYGHYLQRKGFREVSREYVKGI
jgi:hypothetical protein